MSTKNYELNYIFESPERLIMPKLTKEKQIGKFTFSPPEKNEIGFKVSFQISAKSLDDARKNKVADDLANIFSMFSLFGLKPHLISGRGVEPEIKEGKKVITAFQSFTINAKVAKKIDDETLFTCEQFLTKFHNLSNQMQEIIRRSLHFFGRGKRDTDPADSFLDYWISLENLSKLFTDNIEGARCVKCNHIYDPRPIRGILKALLKQWNLEDKIETLEKLYEKRAEIVHPRSHDLDKIEPHKLAELVSSLIIKMVNNQPKT